MSVHQQVKLRAGHYYGPMRPRRPSPTDSPAARPSKREFAGSTNPITTP